MHIKVQAFNWNEEKLEKLLSVYVWVIAFYILLSLLGPRLPSLLEWPNPEISADFLKYFQRVLFFSAILLLALNQKARSTLICISLIWAVLHLHAYLIFYKPNFDNLFSAGDLQMSPRISAKWSLTVAKHYLKSILGNTIIFLPLLFFKYKEFLLKSKSILMGSIVVAALVNGVIALYQRFYESTFLTAGSGTALAAKRTPALLEDSAAATIFFTIFASGFLLCVFIKNQSRTSRLSYLLLFLLCLAAGFFGVGRAFFLGLIPILVMTPILFMQASLKKLGLVKSLVLVLSFVSALALAFYGMSKIYISKSFQLLLNYWNTLDFSDMSLLTLFSKIDRPRFEQWQAMWQAMQTRPFVGTGLGSSQANLDLFYGGKTGFLDWPGSFYLMLVSELGAGGWLAVAALLAFMLALVFSVIFDGRAKVLSNSLDSFNYAASLSLLVTYLVGIHFVFQSIGVMFVFMAIFSIHCLMQRFFFVPVVLKLFGWSFLGLITVQTLILLI